MENEVHNLLQSKYGNACGQKDLTHQFVGEVTVALYFWVEMN